MISASSSASPAKVKRKGRPELLGRDLPGLPSQGPLRHHPAASAQIGPLLDHTMRGTLGISEPQRRNAAPVRYRVMSVTPPEGGLAPHRFAAYDLARFQAPAGTHAPARHDEMTDK